MSPDTVVSHRWPILLIAGITFINGLFAILEIILIRFSQRLEALLPFDYEALSRNLGLFAGFALIYFSGRLLAQKRLAWYVAVIGSCVIVIANIVYAHRIDALLLPGLSLILLVAYRDQFQVESEPITTSQGLRLFLVTIVVALAYGTIGFYLLLRRDFGYDFNLVQSFNRTLREYSLYGNTDLITRTREARWFLDSLDIFGVLTFGFAIFSLFRPLSYRYVTQPTDRAQARRILELYGKTSEDSFKLWPEDKAYFFGSDGDSFIAYRVSNGVALALGEAIGSKTALPRLVAEFAAFCRRHDWAVAYIYLYGASLPLYEATGLRSIKIGEDAIVELDNFISTTMHNKHFRSVVNKFTRLGYRFEATEPPQAPSRIRQMGDVTRSWLRQNGRTERGFALGYHDRSYLARSSVYCMYDKSGKMIAFANGIKSYNPKQATIDLMRYRYDAETGVMDYLSLCIMKHLYESGWKEFSFGLAPLSGLDDNIGRNLETRVLVRLARINFASFSFDGLRRYKNKFNPRWEPRYLAYDRGGVGLGMTALAISRLIKPVSVDEA